MAKRVVAECLQLHGGYGYMEEYEIARRYRDIPVAAIYAATTRFAISLIHHFAIETSLTMLSFAICLVSSV